MSFEINGREDRFGRLHDASRYNFWREFHGSVS